jgi:hypothetical protein
MPANRSLEIVRGSRLIYRLRPELQNRVEPCIPFIGAGESEYVALSRRIRSNPKRVPQRVLLPQAAVHSAARVQEVERQEQGILESSTVPLPRCGRQCTILGEFGDKLGRNRICRVQLGADVPALCGSSIPVDPWAGMAVVCQSIAFCAPKRMSFPYSTERRP